jgi:hypothetical protein
LAKPFTLKAWTVGGVAVWIVIQGMFPIRHALIPGDVRVTFEGLEWSWRLKAEVYQSTPVVISVRDPVIQPSTSGTGGGSIDWKAWGGDPVIYHPLEPGQVDWAKLPEVVVLLDPWTGDRILYNTLSASVTERSESAAKVRNQQLWNQRNGRIPDSVNRSVPLARIVEGYVRTMRARGYPFRNTQ